MVEFFESLIGLMGAIGLSLASAYSVRTKTFSTDIFMSALALALCVLVYIDLLPMIAITIVVIMIVIQLFGIHHSGTDTGE